GRSMHPIERLRWVARSPEGDLSAAAAEAAEALAAFADDPAGLVIASRRLIERRPEAAPLWWLASRMLCSLEPEFEAISAAAELERDRTPVALAGAGRSAGAAADRVVVLASGPGAEAPAPDWRRDEAWGCADWLQSHGVDA